MPLTLKIAWRYLFAPKSHHAVNTITRVAVTGVAVAAMAMVVVLSVFNGFNNLARKHLSLLDAPYRISRTDSRPIANGDSLSIALAALPEVRTAVPTVLSRGLAIYGNAQSAIIFKGVPESDYTSLVALDSAVIDGQFALRTTVDEPAAYLSVGVANNLLAVVNSQANLSLYVPRRQGRINPAAPGTAFRSAQTAVSGVFRVDQQDIDAEYVIIPLETARSLMDYDKEATAIEANKAPEVSDRQFRNSLQKVLGPQFRVEDRLQQRAQAFRMINVEKWITFLMLACVLFIALFNIVGTLSLLIIEKRNNMHTLRAMGATVGTVRAVFVWEAWLITMAGGIIGCIVGAVLSIIQQYGHVIKLNADPAALSVEAYPAALNPLDLLAVMATVALTGLICALTVRLLIPSRDINTLPGNI